jgi:hypothetical protein
MPIDWDNLIDNIYKKKCVLLLGPSLSFFKKKNHNISLPDQLIRSILLFLNRKKLAYEADQCDNLPYLLDCYFTNTKTADNHQQIENFLRRLDKFCDAVPIPPLYTNLASLPFDSVICTSPDTILTRALNDAGFEYNFDAYTYRTDDQQTQNGEAVKKVKPAEENETFKRIKVVYNLCGSLKNGPNQVIMTEYDRVVYLKHVITNGPPSNVLGRLDSEKSYLFLDFDFDDWQFKLLMEILKPQKIKAKFLYAPKSRKNIKNINIEYFRKWYNIGYLDTDTTSFVEELTRRYTEKYGDPLRKFKAYLAYEENDKQHATMLKQLIVGMDIEKRVTLWDPADIQFAQDVEAETKKNFDESEIYIPLINYTFPANKVLKAQLDKAIELAKQGKKKIFPIIIGNVEYEKRLPDLAPNSQLVLPIAESLPQASKAVMGLNAKLKIADEPESVYIEILKLINSEIK